jgi:Short C-terminal domain
MPGLIRGVARTAVVAGTASAVGGRVHHRQQQRWAQQEAEAQQQAYAQQGYPQQGYPQQGYPQQQVYEAPPAAPAEDPMVAQLKQLAQLHDQGILTDEEFAAQKAKILGT